MPALTGAALHDFSHQLPNWNVVDEHHTTRTFKFPDFQQVLDFVNRGASSPKGGDTTPIFFGRGAEWRSRCGHIP
jgi:pterin-4a-carbinolamine dehydratase